MDEAGAACCIVGRHPQIAAINAALVAGGSARSVARDFGTEEHPLKKSSVAQHRIRCGVVDSGTGHRPRGRRRADGTAPGEPSLRELIEGELAEAAEAAVSRPSSSPAGLDGASVVPGAAQDSGPERIAAAEPGPAVGPGPLPPNPGDREAQIRVIMVLAAAGAWSTSDEAPVRLAEAWRIGAPLAREIVAEAWERVRAVEGMPGARPVRPPAALPAPIVVQAAADAAVVDAVELDRPELTEELLGRIVESVEAGGWRIQAALAAGVPLRDFEAWILLAHEGKQPYARLLADMRRAEAAAEDNYVRAVANAAASDWKAASWLLSARFPHRWARGADRGAVGQQSPRSDEAVQQFLGLVGRVLDVFAPGVREKLAEGLELYEREAAYGVGAGLVAVDTWLETHRVELAARDAPLGEVAELGPATPEDTPEPEAA